MKTKSSKNSSVVSFAAVSLGVCMYFAFFLYVVGMPKGADWVKVEETEVVWTHQ